MEQAIELAAQPLGFDLHVVGREIGIEGHGV
jgi:hypothetical protein